MAQAACWHIFTVFRFPSLELHLMLASVEANTWNAVPGRLLLIVSILAQAQVHKGCLFNKHNASFMKTLNIHSQQIDACISWVEQRCYYGLSSQFALGAASQAPLCFQKAYRFDRLTRVGSKKFFLWYIFIVYSTCMNYFKRYKHQSSACFFSAFFSSLRTVQQHVTCNPAKACSWSSSVGFSLNSSTSLSHMLPSLHA